MRAKRVTEAILAPESESHLVGFCIFSALQNLAQKSFLGTWRKRVNPSSHLPKTEVKNLTASFINLLKSFLHSFEDLQNLLRISTSTLARSKEWCCETPSRCFLLFFGPAQGDVGKKRKFQIFSFLVSFGLPGDDDFGDGKDLASSLIGDPCWLGSRHSNAKCCCCYALALRLGPKFAEVPKSQESPF